MFTGRAYVYIVNTMTSDLNRSMFGTRLRYLSINMAVSVCGQTLCFWFVVFSVSCLHIQIIKAHGHAHADHGHEHDAPEPVHFKYSRQANEEVEDLIDDSFEEEHYAGHDDHAHDHHGHAHGEDTHHGHAHDEHDHHGHAQGHQEASNSPKAGDRFVKEQLQGIGLWVRALGSTALVSCAPVLILLFIPLDNTQEHASLLKTLLAFAAGGLLGDAFLHLIPHALSPHSHGGEPEDLGHDHSHEGHAHDHGPALSVGLWVLVGIVSFLAVEKIVRFIKQETDQPGHGHSHSAKKVPVEEKKVDTKSKTESETKEKTSEKSEDKEKKAGSDEKSTEKDDTKIDSEEKKADGDEKTADSEEKKADGDEKTADSEEKKADGDEKTADSEEKKADGDEKTADSEEKKADGDEKTADSGEMKTKKIEDVDQVEEITKTPVLKTRKGDIKVAAYLNLAADAAHNFTDGLAIGVSYLLSQNIGILTTITILLHEVPHEVGDFAILVQSGCSKRKAMMLQFTTAIGAMLGTIVSLLLGGVGDAAMAWILPFTAGGFIYIACVSVLPELLSESSLWQTLKELTALFVGILMMIIIAGIE